MPPKQAKANTGRILRSNPTTSQRQLRSAGPVTADTAATAATAINVVSARTKTRTAHKGSRARPQSADGNPVDLETGHDEANDERGSDIADIDRTAPVGEVGGDGDGDGDGSKTTVSASRYLCCRGSWYRSGDQSPILAWAGRC
jgi:hypothetical protein